VIQKKKMKTSATTSATEEEKEVDVEAFVRDLVVMQTQRECPEEIDAYHMLNYVLSEPPLLMVLGDRRRSRLKGKVFM
jgi:hypothetical protein